MIRYGEQFSRTAISASVGELTLPAPVLREISIVDTPGTNAIFRQHEALTQEFVPRSDIVLFVTSVDRPYTESERLFLEVIRDWGKKVVFVVNKIDILESPEELDHILDFWLTTPGGCWASSPRSSRCQRACHARHGVGGRRRPGGEPVPGS